MSIKDIVENRRKEILQENLLKKKIVSSWTKKRIESFCNEVSETGFAVSTVRQNDPCFPNGIFIRGFRLDVFIPFTMTYEEAVDYAASTIAEAMFRGK